MVLSFYFSQQLTVELQRLFQLFPLFFIHILFCFFVAAENLRNERIKRKKGEEAANEM